MIQMMKLRILPPTLRVKKRYIAFEVVSQVPLTRDDLINLIWDGSQDLYGACGTGKFDIWVVKVWKCDFGDYENSSTMKGILRCNRNELDAVKSVIPTITKFRGQKVVFHTLGISGTIKATIKNFIKPEG